MKHLWEVIHPYYASDSNYFSNDCSNHYESWSDFVEVWGDAHLDYNVVFRFDWHNHENPGYEAEENSWPEGHDQLNVYVVGQRTGIYVANSVFVTKDQENDVKAWLQPRLNYLLSLWTPFVSAE